MILPTPSRSLPFRSKGTSFWVKVKTRWTLSVRSLENAVSGYFSSSSPQVAPELLT
jgi:hypothetical protein